MPRELSSAAAGFEQDFEALLADKRESDEDVGAAVAAILEDVRTRGDAALVDYTRRFDRVDLSVTGLALGEAEIAAAIAEANADTHAALVTAADRIRAFHVRQMPADDQFTDAEGVRLGLRWTAIREVGWARSPQLCSDLEGIPRLYRPQPRSGIFYPLLLSCLSQLIIYVIIRKYPPISYEEDRRILPNQFYLQVCISIYANAPFSFKICQTLGGVIGISMWVTPR